MNPEPYPYPANGRLLLADSFPHHQLANGRRVVQLTTGAAFCYPLYYYIPSISCDLRYLIYHRSDGHGVQLHRLDLTTGADEPLTQGTVPQTGWDNWDDEAGPGILDHRSVLNVARNEVIFFAGERGELVCANDLTSRQTRELFALPPDRYAGGQNCVSPDGRYLVYISTPVGSRYLEPLPDTPSQVRAYDFATQQDRSLCEVPFHIHHVIPYDNDHFVVCHTPNGCGLFMTSVTKGGCDILRAGDPGLTVRTDVEQMGGHPCHYVTTPQGIAYEVTPLATGVEQGANFRQAVGVTGGFQAGLYDPFRRARFEFPLPDHFQTTHVGWDPQGLRWFWEIAESWAESARHQLVSLRGIDSAGKAEYLELTPPRLNFGRKQKSHHHPQITPDPAWLLMVAGDDSTQTNHIFLLDVADVPASTGVGPDLLSPTGANDYRELPYSITSTES